MSDVKETNPKQFIGASKVPMHLWPSIATAYGSLALMDGALKYGYANYRESGVRVSTYIAAALRHIYAYLEGEWEAEDSTVPHLGHALACLAIIIDAEVQGKLNDDRPIGEGYADAMAELLPIVEFLHEEHKDKEPRHYTRAAAEREEQDGEDEWIESSPYLGFNLFSNYLACDYTSHHRSVSPRVDVVRPGDLDAERDEEEPLPSQELRDRPDRLRYDLSPTGWVVRYMQKDMEDKK